MKIRASAPNMRVRTKCRRDQTSRVERIQDSPFFLGSEKKHTANKFTVFDREDFISKMSDSKEIQGLKKTFILRSFLSVFAAYKSTNDISLQGDLKNNTVIT